MKYSKKACFTKEIDEYLENIVHEQMEVILIFKGLVIIYFQNNMLLYIKLHLRN